MAQPDSLSTSPHGFDYEPTREDLRNLRDWLNRIPYLPHDMEDHELASYVRTSKGSLERTKNRIDKFYEGRVKYPEILRDLNPLSPAAQTDMDLSIKVPLPKRTADGCVIIVTKVKDSALASIKFEPVEIFRTYATIFRTLLMENKLGSGRIIFIADGENVKLAHIKKITPNLVMTILSIISSFFPCRIAAIHAIHLPQFAEWIVNLGKSILKTKIAERIHVHRDPEDLLKLYPKEILPVDFGGEEESLEKLQYHYRKKLESFAPRFLEFEQKLRKLDALRPKSDDVMVGSFRNLQVD